tara:strand:- start:13498 stop:13899 length:402 start_codon:yes stop_codon:yes gene_type:complete
MELTGKCKEEFEKWINFYGKHHVEDRFNKLLDWGTLTDSMQYGVYVDYFDSVGIYIQLTPYFDSVKEVVLWFFTLENKRCVHLNSHLENKANTRPEVRTKAIEKANEIRNKQFENEQQHKLSKGELQQNNKQL